MTRLGGPLELPAANIQPKATGEDVEEEGTVASSPYPGHVDALSNASTARCTVKLSVHKYDSVRHDQREPSAVSVHDEHETGEFVRRPARHEARLHHQEHQRSAIGASPRPSIHMPRLDSAVLQSLRCRSRGCSPQVTMDEKMEA